MIPRSPFVEADGGSAGRDRLADEWVGKTVASSEALETGRRVPRNVRAPQGRTVGNTHPEQSARKCNRKQTATAARPG